MIMAKEIKDILSIYEGILNNKQIIKEANLFGGATFKWGGGASDHRSRPLGNWQSDNAWDIMAPQGTPVYSISDGTITKLSGELKLKGTVYGLSVTVNTGDNEIFYTHLGSLGGDIKEGNKISKGTLVGYIGKPEENPNWPTHVHIGLKSGSIEKYLNGSGDIVGGENVTTSGSTSNTTSGSTYTSTGKYDIGLPPGYSAPPSWATTAAKASLGKLTEASTKGEKFYLQFCNISKPMVKNGQSISVGTILGKTSDDVEVYKYDSTKTRVNLKKGELNLGKNVQLYLGVIKLPKDSNEKIKSPVSGVVNNLYNTSCKNQITIEYLTGESLPKEKIDKTGKEREMTYKDPALAAILTLPSKIFKNQYDDAGNLTQKRFGYSGEKVDPWIKDAITAPFKEIGKLFKKENKEEDERKKKKVDEKIERIKKLL